MKKRGIQCFRVHLDYIIIWQDMIKDDIHMFCITPMLSNIPCTILTDTGPSESLWCDQMLLLLCERWLENI